MRFESSFLRYFRSPESFVLPLPYAYYSDRIRSRGCIFQGTTPALPLSHGTNSRSVCRIPIWSEWRPWLNYSHPIICVMDRSSLPSSSESAWLHFLLPRIRNGKSSQFPVMGEKVKLQAKVEAPAEHELKLYDWKPDWKKSVESSSKD